MTDCSELPWRDFVSLAHVTDHPSNPRKIDLESPLKPPKNMPKSTPRRSKIEVWRGFRWRSLFDPNFFRSWLVLGLLLGASWGAPEPSWSVLGASRGRPGPVLGASSAVLGASSSILCSSWGVLWILCGKAFENHRFYVRISNPEPLKI